MFGLKKRHALSYIRCPAYVILLVTVPESATGSQGLKPLVDGTNVVKGSRQTGTVTLEKGLALETKLM